MSWRCLCGHSAVFTEDRVCDRCGKPILSSVNPTAINVMRNQLGIQNMSGDETKDRFIEFYNARRPEVALLSDADLVETINQLEALCLEAKANLRAAHDERNERRAKLSHSRKEWIVTPDIADQTTSDAIAAVKVRKERMTKADKLLENLKAAGFDEKSEIYQDALRKLKVVPTSTLSKATFKKIPEISQSDLTDAIKLANEATKKTQPFNPFDGSSPESKESRPQPFNPFGK